MAAQTEAKFTESPKKMFAAGVGAGAAGLTAGKYIYNKLRGGSAKSETKSGETANSGDTKKSETSE